MDGMVDACSTRGNDVGCKQIIFVKYKVKMSLGRPGYKSCYNFTIELKQTAGV